MKNEPFISVVVPTYNRAHLITSTLASLLDQNYKNYEVIVVDDGSTDNTEDVVLAIPDDRLKYFNKDNAERAAARNYGTRLAKGDYINFFDSDDIALPNHLGEAAKMIISKNWSEWFHLGYAWASPERKILKKINRYTKSTSNHLLPYGNPVGTNTVFIRKDIALSNPFDEDRELSASEDYELWFRLAVQYPFYADNTITSLLIQHSERSVLTSTPDNLEKRLLLCIKKVTCNDQVVNYYGNRLNLIRMELYSYLALHLSDMASAKYASIYNLAKAFYASPNLLLRKRFYTILRNILFVR